MFRRFSLAFTATVAFSGAIAFGQDVISARSGLVHYVEGDVSIDGKPVADRNGTFSEVKKDGELATALGRAEILLTPGVFLRVGENSSIRMRATALDDTKVEFVSGKTMLESDTPMKDNRVTIQYKDYAVTPVDHGIYEFSSEPAALAVYAGEADVTAGGQTVRVKAGKRLIFSAASTIKMAIPSTAGANSAASISLRPMFPPPARPTPAALTAEIMTARAWGRGSTTRSITCTHFCLSPAWRSARSASVSTARSRLTSTMAATAATTLITVPPAARRRPPNRAAAILHRGIA
jgi:hypothetical protein